MFSPASVIMDVSFLGMAPMWVATLKVGQHWLLSILKHLLFKVVQFVLEDSHTFGL